jgi:hypothetical protein
MVLTAVDEQGDGRKIRRTPDSRRFAIASISASTGVEGDSAATGSRAGSTGIVVLFVIRARHVVAAKSWEANAGAASGEGKSAARS